VNNPQVRGPKLDIGRFSIAAGRMPTGTGKVKLELFLNGAIPVAVGENQVNPQGKPSKMAVGQEARRGQPSRRRVLRR